MSICLCVLGIQTFAQFTIRPDDHFWRKRIVNRLILDEKINRPLVRHESEWYADDGQYAEKDGLIASLINGVKQGKYLAYHPDDWEKGMNYDELVARMKEFDQAMTGEDDWGEADTFEEIEGFEPTGEAKEEAAEEWVFEPAFDEAPLPQPENQPEAPYEIDLAPYEQVVHMVEDRIFDKNRSSMLYNIAFFEVVWVDPSGVLPEKVLARFKWKDVEDQLAQTRWKNRFNDAYAHSLKDAFVMRMFHSFIIDVGGEPVNSLLEAERRRQEMVEFEHNLWSY